MVLCSCAKVSSRHTGLVTFRLRKPVSRLRPGEGREPEYLINAGFRVALRLHGMTKLLVCKGLNPGDSKYA